MEQQELEIQMQNNQLMYEMLQEMKKTNELLTKQTLPTETCTPSEAMILCGFTNPRLLNHFFKLTLLNRRKGGVSFLYFRKECSELADRIKAGTIKVPTLKEMYGKA